jgi:hypothetical protein
MLIAVLGLLNTTIVLAQHDHGEHVKPNKLSIQVGHLFDIYSDLQQALSKDDQKIVYKHVINLDKMFKSVDVKIIKKI